MRCDLKWRHDVERPEIEWEQAPQSEGRGDGHQTLAMG
jgi:hypothetical protein